ncbi:MAG: hypothetical protein C0506_13765 [Anaerolinea sp.]|nr:hypothetical protein [Anaerolinea sp.]
MKIQRLRHWRSLSVTLGVLAAAGLLQFADANPAVSQTLFVTAYEAPDDPGLDPTSGVWKDAPAVRVPLSAQLGSYAAGGGSVATVSAQALHYKEKLYLRVQWADPTVDENTTKVEDFSDAVALEFPARSASSVPAICMGQADAGVNIWHWRADSQKGLTDPVNIYVGALVDQDVKKDTLFYTARDAGNPFANPELGPVQTLISRTFGTLSPANVQDVAGKGVRAGDGWAVVFSRAYRGSDFDQAAFAAGTKTDMAVAVWNGSEDDRNGRKSVSQFVTLQIAATEVPGGGGNGMVFGLAVLSLLGLSAIGVGLAVYGMKESGGR